MAQHARPALTVAASLLSRDSQAKAVSLSGWQHAGSSRKAEAFPCCLQTAWQINSLLVQW